MSTELPGYVLHERVGEGTAATVWRAEPRERRGRVVAVKRLKGPVDPASVRALRDEGEALDRLGHPSILRLLDVVGDGDGVALVLPYAPGGTLAARIAAEVRLAPAEVADLGARLAGALAAAHGTGLVHRDVKPANVLFDAEGQPLLADFGTARLLGDDRAAVAGTAEYLDPEALTGPPRATNDVYGLGATLYEALAGVPPYAGSTPRAMLLAADRGLHGPLAQLVDAPRELTEAVEAALARDPAARPATAAEFAGRLDEAHRRLQSDRPAPPPPGAEAPISHSGEVPTPQAGDGAAERSGTRPFGPAPPRTATTNTRRRAPGRRVLLTAAVLAVAAVLGVTAWLAWGRAPDGDGDATPLGGEATERTPPPRCEDVPEPETTSGAELHEADVAGRDCSVPVAWDGELLVVPRAEGLPRRYDLDARDEDELLLGDWNCDGRDTPALYRPSTGELFVFSDFAEAGEELTGRVEDTRASGGEPRVVTDEAGCDRLVVDPG